MTPATLFTLPEPNTPIWKHEHCAVCGGGFSEKSWDERHTWLVDGISDIHARCCRCRGRYDHDSEVSA
jgi:hypothetical protein